MHKCLLVLLVLFSSSAVAGTTRWTDAQGNVHYSDQPAPKSAQSQKVLPPTAKPPVPSEAEQSQSSKTYMDAVASTASITDVAAVPYLKAAGRAHYEEFLTRAKPRAFIVCRNGNFTEIYGERAHDESMPSQAGKGCAPYAIDDKVVWKGI